MALTLVGSYFTRTEVRNLKPRDVFERLNQPHILVTLKGYRADGTGWPEALNLETGVVVEVNPNELVQPLDATLTINGRAEVPAGPRLTPAEDALIRNHAVGGGGRIQAIKSVRERLGWGLKEAKEFVDAEAARLGIKF